MHHFVISNYRFDSDPAVLLGTGVLDAYPEGCRRTNQLVKTTLGLVLKNAFLCAQYELNVMLNHGVKELITIMPVGSIEKILKIELRYNPDPLQVTPLKDAVTAWDLSDQTYFLCQDKERAYLDYANQIVTTEAELGVMLHDLLDALAGLGGGKMLGIQKTSRFNVRYHLQLTELEGYDLMIHLYRGKSHEKATPAQTQRALAEVG